MKIEINLESSKFCKGCPCINSDYEQGSSCNLGFWNDNEQVWMWEKNGKLQKERPVNDSSWELVEVRPQECIDKHGL